MPFLPPLVLLASLAAPPSLPLAQDDGGSGKAVIAARTELETLLTLHARAHGGEENLLGLRTLAFDVSPFSMRDGKEVAGDPLHFEVRFAGASRVVRVEEQLDGRPVVKLTEGTNSRVWVGGEERQVPELVGGALIEASTMLAYLDLILRPDSRELARRLEGVRKRDGIAYVAVHLEFDPARTGGVVLNAYRCFFHPETHLVERIDVHDAETRRRNATVLVQQPTDVSGLKFPGRIVFQDRDGEVQGGWVFRSPQVNPELSPERFTAP
jgi:hypothetical protein